jgi:glycosyltransferase involved in cell wall biosynthesis
MDKTLTNDSKDGILISVVIPVYNRPDELKRAIRSVLAQTFQQFEIIVTDDGSEVDIKTLCGSFEDDRIRYVRNDEHTNANIARNRGIKAARGDYIAMLDSDDAFLPNHLERRLAKIQEWNCDGIFGSAYFDDGTSRALVLSRPRRPEEPMIEYLLSDGFAPTPSHFYKREAALAVMWDETLDRHQDFDFSVRFADRFLFFSDYDPTIVVDRRVQKKRSYRYDSCIRFIDRFREQLPGRIYNQYHFSMFMHVQGNAVIDKQIERHYAENSYRYIYAVSFSRFLFVHKVKRIFYGMIFLKFICLHILFFLNALLFGRLPPEMRNNSAWAG